jgi:CubicO group peptidase (beta-lactamase class C family)
MRRALAPPLAALTILLACTDDTDDPAADRAAEPVVANDRCDPALDAAFAAWADAGFSGTVAITRAGEPECLAAYGTADQDAGTPNTLDTVFSIGSVSKAFTAAAVVDLAESGVLALDDRAGGLVPGLSGPVAEATVEQLLLHTSGLTGSHGSDHEPLGRDEAVAAIGDLELAFAPGSDFLYSNAGYTLLALIIEETAGKGYRDHLATEILPLPDERTAGGFWDGEPAAPGPRAVGHLDDGPTDVMGGFDGPHWALAGNGDLAMTTRDLADWTHALFTGQVVSPATAELVSRPGFDHGDGTAETPGWVAFDRSRFGEPFLAAAGGGGDVGHDVVTAWLPESERVVALASHTPEVTAEDLLQAVGPALVAGDRLPVPEVPPGGDIDPGVAAAVAGTYELDTGGSFAVTARDGVLAATPRGTAAVAALYPPPDGVTAADVAAHEDGVSSLLAGESRQGREELDTLARDFGAVEDVEILGTVFQEGELRTYVDLTTSDDPITLWYALDDRGGIAAVDGPADLPALVLGPSDGGEWRPADPTGDAPDVTVAFAGGHMTVTGPGGTTTARMVD